MALVKTYLLAPNFTFRSDGPIALGNIIADPFVPHKVLTRLDPTEPAPEIENAVEYDHKIGTSTRRRLTFGVWTRFLESINGSAGSEQGKTSSAEYTMSTLRTSYFRSYPTGDELRERVMAPIVSNIMRLGSAWPRPVYMVTGVKVAEGFAASTEKTSSSRWKAGAPVVAAAGASARANMGLSKESGRHDSFQAGNDIVFAYQLARIAPKGWRSSELQATEYRSKAAFLGDELSEREEETDTQTELTAVTAADLIGIDGEESSVVVFEVDDGDDKCICIAFKEN